MIQLWKASPNKQINDISIQIEKNLFEIRKLEAQLADAQNKMRHANGYLTSMQEAVDNLKKEESRIVSMNEYLQLKNDINKVSNTGISIANTIQTLLKTIDNFKRVNLQLIEQRKDIEANTGRVLEFKKRG